MKLSIILGCGIFIFIILLSCRLFPQHWGVVLSIMTMAILSYIASNFGIIEKLLPSQYSKKIFSEKNKHILLIIFISVVSCGVVSVFFQIFPTYLVLTMKSKANGVFSETGGPIYENNLIVSHLDEKRNFEPSGKNKEKENSGSITDELLGLQEKQSIITKKKSQFDNKSKYNELIFISPQDNNNIEIRETKWGANAEYRDIHIIYCAKVDDVKPYSVNLKVDCYRDGKFSNTRIVPIPHDKLYKGQIKREIIYLNQRFDYVEVKFVEE